MPKKILQVLLIDHSSSRAKTLTKLIAKAQSYRCKTVLETSLDAGLQALQSSRRDIIIVATDWADQQDMKWLWALRKLDKTVPIILIAKSKDPVTRHRMLDRVKAIWIDVDILDDRLLDQALRNIVWYQSNFNALKISNAYKDHFIAVVAHELRNPLMVIHEGLRLILKDVRKHLTAQQSEILDVVFDDTKRLQSYVVRVLDIEHIENGKYPLQKEKLDLKSIIENQIKYFKIQYNAAKYTLIYPPSGLKNVVLDPDMVKQILINVIGNSLKYCPKKSTKITIKLKKITRDKKPIVHMEIRDNGPGISKDHLPQAFQKFTRFTKKKEAVGYGIGLRITEQLVQLQGGNIWIESELGKGTSVHIQWPQPPKKPVVLVVDQDKRAESLLKKLYSSKDVKVYAVTRADDGIKFVKKTPPDLVLIDNQLPKMGISKFLKQISVKDHHFPVVGMSESVVMQTTDYTVGYLSKPIQPNQLQELIKQYFPGVNGLRHAKD